MFDYSLLVSLHFSIPLSCKQSSFTANDLGKKSYNIGSIRYKFRECFVRLYTTFCVHPNRIPERTEKMVVELKKYSKSVFALHELFPVELKKYESIKEQAAELVSYIKRGKENCQCCGSKHRRIFNPQKIVQAGDERSETPVTLKVISRLSKVRVDTPTQQAQQTAEKEEVVSTKLTFDRHKFIENELTVSDSTAKRRRGRYHIVLFQMVMYNVYLLCKYALIHPLLID